MRGKDVFPRRWPLSRSFAAATAIVALLCGRGGSAAAEQSTAAGSVPVDDTVTVTVVGTPRSFQLKVVPEVFVIRNAAPRRAELARCREMAQARKWSAPELAKCEESARVGFPDPLTFGVKDLPEGHLIEIDFRSQASFKGPFLLEMPDPSRPVRGRYVFERGVTRIQSGQIDVGHFPDPSVWKYEVVLRRKVGDHEFLDLVAIDPMGVLK